jgi:hypothetical protein
MGVVEAPRKPTNSRFQRRIQYRQSGTNWSQTLKRKPGPRVIESAQRETARSLGESPRTGGDAAAASMSIYVCVKWIIYRAENHV